MPPYLTFAIGELHNILALFVFLGVSALISWLIADAREQAREAQRRADDVSRLYELTQVIIGAHQPDDVLPAIAAEGARCVCRAGVLDFAARPPAASPGGGPGPRRCPCPQPDELALADWVGWHGSEAAQGGLTGPRCRVHRDHGLGLYAAAGRRADAWACWASPIKRDQRPFTAAERTVLATFADQTAVALDRLLLLREAQRAELLARTDELKSALMSAVSHDLRTPLASIIASVTSLLEPEMHWDEETRRDFLQGIYDEAAAAQPAGGQSARHVAHRGRGVASRKGLV